MVRDLNQTATDVDVEAALAQANAQLNKTSKRKVGMPKIKAPSARDKLDTSALGNMNANEVKKSLHIPGIYKSELITADGTATRTKNLRGWSKQTDVYEQKYTSRFSYNTEHVRTKKLASNALRDKEVNYASGDKLRTVKLSTAFKAISYKYEVNTDGTKRTVANKILTYSYELGDKKQGSNTRTETIKRAGWSTNRYEVDDKGTRTKTGKSGWGYANFTNKDVNGSTTIDKKKYFGLSQSSVHEDANGNKTQLAKRGLLTSTTRQMTTDEKPGVVTKKSAFYQRVEVIPSVGNQKVVETKALFGLYKHTRNVTLSPEELKQRDQQKDATRPKTWVASLSRTAQQGARALGQGARQSAYALGQAAYNNPWGTAAVAASIAAYVTNPVVRGAVAMGTSRAALGAAVFVARHAAPYIAPAAAAQMAYGAYQYWTGSTAKPAQPVNSNLAIREPALMRQNTAVTKANPRAPTSYEAVAKWVGDTYNYFAGAAPAVPRAAVKVQRTAVGLPNLGAPNLSRNSAPATNIEARAPLRPQPLSVSNVETINARSGSVAASTSPSEMSFKSAASAISRQSTASTTGSVTPRRLPTIVEEAGIVASQRPPMSKAGEAALARVTAPQGMPNVSGQIEQRTDGRLL